MPCAERLGTRESRRARGWGLRSVRAPSGEVPEWLNGLVSKTSVSLGAPGVQIPPSPPFLPAAPVAAAGGGDDNDGEVSERLNEHAWKACVSETAPGVRIPPSPPSLIVSRSTRLRALRRKTPSGTAPEDGRLRARRWVRSHAMGRVRTGSGRERSSPKGLDPGARCPGPPAGSHLPLPFPRDPGTPRGRSGRAS